MRYKVIRLLVGLAVVVGWGVATPVVAKTWLYQSPPAHPNLGQPISGWPGVRVLTDRQRRQLPGLVQQRLVQNFSYHALFTPNDPDFSAQWNLNAINLPGAWDADTQDPLYGGDSRVVVAVLDTGLATAAPDLSGLHLWTNSGEVPGDGIDNDHDGLVDDIHGWDFVHSDNAPDDDNGHGTHVTGTIAESTNNGVSAAGIAFNTTIMPLKVLDANGSGSTATIAAAINFAVSHGATIINLSLGGTEDDSALHQVIQTAAAQGVVLTAASGNSGASNVNYPAVYPEVIAVGATTQANLRASYSNYGSGLDLMAPGDQIIQQTCSTGSCQTFNDQAYSGTSQAAAHVSGVAALVAACGASTAQISNLLYSTASDLGPVGVDDEYGYGLLNASAALTAAGCTATIPTPPVQLQATSAKDRQQVLVSGRIYGFTQPYFSWSGPVGQVYQVTWGVSGQTATSSQIAQTFHPKLINEGTYTLTVASINGVGLASAPVTFVYQYRRPTVVIAGGHQLRLYDQDLRSTQRLTVNASSTSISGGRLGRAQANRLVFNLSDAPGKFQLLTTTGKTILTVTPFADRAVTQLSSAILERSSGSPQLVIGTGDHGASLRWYSSSLRPLATQTIFQTYRGGLRLAHADVDGDGNDELIVGQVSGPEIRVYSPDRQRLAVLRPLGSKYQGGWYVTSGDVDGDGHQEIIAVAAQAGSRRQVFALTLHGVHVKRWKLDTGAYTGPLDVVGSDVIGDGADRLFVVPRASGSWLQQWSLSGVKQRQVTLSSINLLRLTSLH